VKRLLLDKGELAQFYTSADPVRTIAYCELRQGRARGNHVHHRLVLEDVASRAREETLLRAGDLVVIPPGIAHAIEPVEHGDAIEFSSMAFDPSDTVPYSLV
jgi:mannose-6-phosphate isomerase-like protein (cupin superfamily)